MRTAEAERLEPAVVDQAIRWLVRLRFGTPDTGERQAFQDWLEQAPEHALAWQRACSLDDDFEQLPAGLARSTLDGAQRQLSRRSGLKLLGTLAGVGALGWLSRDYTGAADWLADYRSGTGERRSLQLMDGSRLLLNTDTVVDQRFDGQRRLLVLRHGEIIVNTARDSTRPFWVQTGEGLLRTSGASFLVRRQAQATLVAVREGALGAQPNGQAEHPLGAGEQWQFGSASAHLQPAGLDPWAWADGVISAREARLADVVTELARYRHGLLRCSEEVADLRVSGTYRLDDSEQVLQLLARALPVQLDYRTRYWVTLRGQG